MVDMFFFQLGQIAYRLLHHGTACLWLLKFLLYWKLPSFYVQRINAMVAVYGLGQFSVILEQRLICLYRRVILKQNKHKTISVSDLAQRTAAYKCQIDRT